MARSVNAAAAAIATSCEGTVYTAYRDPTGRLTAGQGHTGPDVRPGVTYTRAQVDAWREADMARAAAFVEARVKVPLSENQFSALAEFAFNVGTGNFAGSTLLRRLNGGDYQSVPRELARWCRGRVNGRLQVLPGLVRRRALEAQLFTTEAGHHVPTPPIVAMAAAPPVAPSLIERARAWLHRAVAK